MSSDDLLKVVFTPGLIDRFAAWKKKHRNSDYVIADIDHWPGHGPRAGEDFPCLLTHGTVVLIEGDKWKLALGKEHLFAQGFNIWPRMHPTFPTARPLPEMMELKEYQARTVGGNCMNLAIQASWMIYVLANIRKVKSFIPAPILPTNAESSDDQGGSDGEQVPASANSQG
eukprot:9488234-Pyramimonas_sp.AAC.1